MKQKYIGAELLRPYLKDYGPQRRPPSMLRLVKCEASGFPLSGLPSDDSRVRLTFGGGAGTWAVTAPHTVAGT